MKTLQQIWQELKANGYETDKGSVHSYIPVYEELLKNYRHSAKKVLEVGLFNGNSLRMWEKYFEWSMVYGIDCSDRPHDGMADLRPIMAEPGHNVHIFDACDKEAAYKAFSKDLFDVIIEDAAHDLGQQVELYRIWRNYLMPGGVYVIEDVQDLDKTADLWIELGGDIIDLRKTKIRYDDVLVIFKKEI